jgi:GNAT superfamily N-acetyltransferase
MNIVFFQMAESKTNKVTRKQSQAFKHFAHTKTVILSDLSLVKCTESPIKNRLKYSLVNYLQNKIERAMLKNEDCDSLWFNFDRILEGWKHGDVYIALDSKNNGYGYLLMGAMLRPVIDYIEVLPVYRGQGVGRFMVTNWEQSCFLRAKKCEDFSSCIVTVYPLPNTEAFWLKLGYTKDVDEQQMTKRIL